MRDIVRATVIGIGQMGSAHARCIASGAIPKMILTAVCDIQPERLAWAAENLPAARRYEDYHSLITEEDVDAVIIAVPHPLHSMISMDAMRAGLHVLTEKPLDIQVSEARKAVNLAEERGVVFAVMLNQRMNPLFRRARDIVSSGQLGEIKRSIWIITNWYRTQHYYDSGDWRASWRGEGGGVLLNQAPHNLDLWQWICGMPRELTAVCEVAKYHHIEVEDEASIFARYENGATGVFLTSTGEYPGTNRLEVSGTRGKMVLEEGKLKLWQLKEDEEKVRFLSEESFVRIPFDYSEWSPGEEPAGHAGILANFAAAILRGEELISPAKDGLLELSLSNAAYLSAWEGNIPVQLPLAEDRFNQLLALHRSKSVQRDPETKRTSEITGSYSERWKTNW